MVDLEEMRAAEEWMRLAEPEEDPSYPAWADLLQRARLELEAHRAVSPLPATGPSVAERLDRCRDRASRIVAGNIAAGNEYDDDIEAVEAVAHLMLAAEREPEVTRG